MQTEVKMDLLTIPQDRIIWRNTMEDINKNQTSTVFMFYCLPSYVIQANGWRTKLWQRSAQFNINIIILILKKITIKHYYVKQKQLRTITNSVYIYIADDHTNATVCWNSEWCKEIVKQLCHTKHTARHLMRSELFLIDLEFIEIYIHICEHGIEIRSWAWNHV